MKKTMIRMMALVLAMTLCLGSLAGCRKNSTDSSEWSDYDDSSDFFEFDDTGSGSNEKNESSAKTVSGTDVDSAAKTGTKSGSKVNKADLHGNKQVVDRDFPWPKLTFKNKTIKWLFWGAEYKKEDEFRTLLREHYGVDLETISVGYNEMSTKLAALVMAGQSPDMVTMIDGSAGNFPGYIYKGLLQPIDDYADFSNSIYKDHAYYYSRTKVNGKNYMLVDNTSTGGIVAYNKKMFREAGVTEPWKLYKQGKWDWNAFADVSSKLIADTDGDGTIDRKAYAIQSGDAFVYTTGQTFGALDHKTKKFKSNLKNANIARAIDFINDLGFTKKYGDHGIVNANDLFKSELVAMNIAADGENVITGGWAGELAKRGDLGLVPVPKDPKADKLYYYVHINCVGIPTGAQNPTGALAYHAVFRYLYSDAERVVKMHESWKKNYGWTDEMIDAYYAAENDGQPVWDPVAWAGNTIVWNSILMGIPWATRVATEAAQTEANIKAAFNMK